MVGELVNVRIKNECFMRKWFFNFVDVFDGKKMFYYICRKKYVNVWYVKILFFCCCLNLCDWLI